MSSTVAAYQDLTLAHRDVNAVTELVKSKAVRVEGVILIAHDAEGKVTVVDTGDHSGRKGMGWGAGVGVAVGLFAPAMLASVVVGGAAGGWSGALPTTSSRPRSRWSSPIRRV